MLKTNGLIIFDDYNYTTISDLNYITNESKDRYMKYYTIDKDKVLCIHDSINMFASIYAPRLVTQSSMNACTAIFKKVSDSFFNECIFL